MVSQLIGHVSSLDEMLQSAYKQLHGTERALMTMLLILIRIGLILLLLDLSTAFDTVDHSVF